MGRARVDSNSRRTATAAAEPTMGQREPRSRRRIPRRARISRGQVDPTDRIRHLRTSFDAFDGWRWHPVWRVCLRVPGRMVERGGAPTRHVVVARHYYTHE